MRRLTVVNHAMRLPPSGYGSSNTLNAGNVAFLSFSLSRKLSYIA